MAQVFTKKLLSGSTNGQPIKVVPTSTPGTLIHTAVAGTSSMDEIWLWAFNSDTTNRKLTIEFGGATSPDDTVEITIPAESGPVPIIPGWLLQNGLTVKAFCATANVVMIAGFVNGIV